MKKLVAYIEWLRNRILNSETKKIMNQLIHIDVYGTIGLAFSDDMEKIISYFQDLEEAASPFKLRIEGPFDQGNREDTMLHAQIINLLFWTKEA